jgi:molybdenum cofactor cytidylyltransferase
MGDTLAAAVQNLPAWQCALVALGDMPCIQPATYQILADGVSRNPAAIARPTFAGAAGHPVAFSSRWFAQLAECRGDRGARSLIAAHPDQVLMIPVDDPGIRVDVDLPQDLARLYAAEAGCAGSR